MKEYDVVRLKQDLPGLNLLKGMEGSIVMVFDYPGKEKAFEVEFLNKDGMTVAIETISAEYLEVAWSS